MTELNKQVADSMDDDLNPSKSDIYKVGAEKTIEELQKLDENDGSLKKWKESLGLKPANEVKIEGDPRRVVLLALALEVEGRGDIVVDVSTPDAIAKAKGQTIVIKEGCEYRFKVTFRVQNAIVSGLKYLHGVRRKGIRVDKVEEMMGSYGPTSLTAAPYERKFPIEEAPSGLLARGTYNVESKFIDDDNVSHGQFEWTFEIKKEWE